jgi:hypothetical protein
MTSAGTAVVACFDDRRLAHQLERADNARRDSHRKFRPKYETVSREAE